MEGKGRSREKAVYVSRCRVWKLKENDNRITYQKNVEAGLSATVCGEDMEGDWNISKTCLLKNAKNVWCDKGPTQAHDSLVVEHEVGKAVKEKGIAFRSWKKTSQGLDRKLEDELKASYCQYYEKLLNEEFDWRRDKLDKVEPVSGPAEEIKCSEVREAIAKSKSDKVFSPSGVVSEMLKAAGEPGVQWVTSIFNGVIRGGIPADWRKSCLVNVYKGKGDALACGSYRGIKLLDQVMKILERVLEKRIMERVTLDEMQCGFRPARGTIDAIFIVRQTQDKFLAKKKELWMAFVDLEKAFDRVPSRDCVVGFAGCGC